VAKGQHNKFPEEFAVPEESLEEVEIYLQATAYVDFW